MPRLSEFYGIVIYIYFREHNPPHFHAMYGEFEIEISIRDLRILKGMFPPKAIGLVMEWASLHKEELMQNWDRIQNGKEGNKIEPLK